MTAAFLKMSFSWRRRAFARRRTRAAFPRVEGIGADAEFFGEFGDGSAEGEQLNGLGLKLGGVLLSWFVGSHGWILLSFGPEI